MYQFSSEVNYFIQGSLLAVMIGVLYNLMVTTRAYGGVIGKSLRFIGMGILFFSIAMIERSLENFSIIQPTLNSSILQDILSLLGLVCVGWGFSKLASASK